MEKNIQVCVSQGSTCFKCEQPVPSGQRCIRFSFDINLLLLKKMVSEEAHILCAIEFYTLLGKRIREATE